MSEFNDVFGEEGVKEVKKPRPVTYVGFVWDHSGSMLGSTELARTNFNEQLVTLKKDADKIDYLVTIIEFDDVVDIEISNQPINEVQELKDYWTGGMTALYDAVGICINKIHFDMEKDKREDKAALIVVMTDGQNNSSKEYNNETIRALVKKMDERNDWTFVFMGAGIDEQQAMDMGFGAQNTMCFNKSDAGFASSSISQSSSLSSYSTMRGMGMKKAQAFYSDDKPDSVYDKNSTVDEDKEV